MSGERVDPLTGRPIVPASPLTPAPSSSDEPAAFHWGLAPSEPDLERPESRASASPPDEATVAYTPPAASVPSHDVATAAFSMDADIAPAFDLALDGATEALAPEPVGTDHPEAESVASSALDSLFAESQFREYTDEPAAVPAAAALVRQPVVVPGGGGPAARGPIPKAQLVLIWVAVGLTAAIALVILFVLGTRLAESLAAPEEAPPVADVEPELPATGTLPPGEYEWSLLRGGECIEPFESAWQEEYTVVECSTPHAAQLVARDTLEDAAFPGQAELETRMTELCTAPEVIDYAAVGGIPDLEVLSAFAADEAEWNEGHHDYFCFAHRTSAEKLTTSIATSR